MTVGMFLEQATSTLRAAGIATARLDSLVLLEDVLRSSRASIIAHPEAELSQTALSTLEQQVTLRSSHTPLAYIRGRVMFYGREFIVNNHVLVPRPETEDIVTILKELPLGQAPHIADIGTGSGCLAITAALELPRSTVDGYDISPDALKVAMQNKKHLRALNVQFMESDLLNKLTNTYDCIIANLPYVPDHYTINTAASFEPALALFAGADGMNAYKLFWQQIQELKQPPRFILAESLPEQHHTNASLARNSGYYLEKTAGLVQFFGL